MHKKKIFTIGVILIIFILTFIFLMPKWENYRMEKKGNKIVATIEKFKAEHGRLPESLGEMGLVDDMHTQPFYSKPSEHSKPSENDYWLCYSWDFDRGYCYFSDTGKWRDTY
jgi:preprotein translocase subunit SecF